MWSDTDNTFVSSAAGSDAERPSELRPASPLRQDPFDNLPSETIVEIFSYAYPVVDLPAHMDPPREYAPRHPDPEILSAVCKRWQAIALTNPSLWATLTIKTRRIKRNDWTRWGFSQLRSCLERSGAYPLNIRIDDSETDTLAAFGILDIVMQSNVIHGIVDIIMLHSERWRSIAFTFALEPEIVQKFNTIDGRLPLLEHLEINLCDNAYFKGKLTGTAFRSAQKLRSLSICPSVEGLDCLRKLQITWTQISELTFSESDFTFGGDLCEILGWLSESLTSLIFLGSFDTRVADSAEGYSRKTTLTRLRRLCILGRSTAILDMLICPSLEDLELNSGTEHEIMTFLDCSSCALTSFKLHFSLHPTTYQTVLQNSALSTLKCISLSDITNPILDILNFDTHRLFPSLETLSLHLAFRRHVDLSQTLYRIEPLSENLHSYFQFDGHSRGPQHLASQIKILRKVVDSRTRTKALNQTRSFIGNLQSNEAQRDARSSLKNCLLHFDLQSNGPEVDDYWDKDPIYALRSFCNWRKIFVPVEISYSWDDIPSPLDSD